MAVATYYFDYFEFSVKALKYWLTFFPMISFSVK